MHCTKLFVIKCWYFSFTLEKYKNKLMTMRMTTKYLGSVTSAMTVWSLTTMLQLPGHSII